MCVGESDEVCFEGGPFGVVEDGSPQGSGVRAVGGRDDQSRDRRVETVVGQRGTPVIGVLLGESVAGIGFEDYALAHALGFGALVLILGEGGLTTDLGQVRDSLRLGQQRRDLRRFGLQPIDPHIHRRPAQQRALLDRHRITVVVAKDSGGATEAKLVAARLRREEIGLDHL